MLDVEKFMEKCGKDCGAVFHGWENRNTERWDIVNITIIRYVRPQEKYKFYLWGSHSMSGKYWEQKKITQAEAIQELMTFIPLSVLQL